MRVEDTTLNNSQAEDPGILDFERRDTGQKAVQCTKYDQTLNLKNQDIASWAYLIEAPKYGAFGYPANLEESLTNLQSYYLIPDPEFLKENPNVQQSVSGREINREKVNFLCVDLYQYLVPKFGVTIPLYFTFIKWHIIILLMIGCIFGVYFCYFSVYFCSDEFSLKFAGEKPVTLNCEFSAQYYFIPQDVMMVALRYEGHDMWIYYGLGIAAQCIILLCPFFYDILMRSTQVQYWEYDPHNNVQFDQKTLYVKHLPRKMTEKEIYHYVINKSEENNINPVIFEDKEGAIEELVYIYDIHNIKEVNEKRQANFLELLKISDLIKQRAKEVELTPRHRLERLEQDETLNLSELKVRFSYLVTELMVQTKQIEIYLARGLPFTNKIIIKMRTEAQADAVYSLYARSKCDEILSKFIIIKRMRKQQKKEQKRLKSMDLNESNLTEDKTPRDVNTNYPDLAKIKQQKTIGQIEDESVDQLEESDLSNQSNISEENEKEPVGPWEQKVREVTSQNYTKRQSLKDMVNTQEFIKEAIARIDFEEKKEDKEDREDDQNKDIHIKRGFREDDIFWLNIGSPSLQRFMLRIMTLTISGVMTSICMLIFELLFVYTNLPENKQRYLEQDVPVWQTVLQYVISVFVAFLSITSSITVLIMTFKSRRSTYTQQEVNLMNYMTIQQFVLILSLPWILALSLWDGLNTTLPIYTLYLLCRVRLIIKSLTHIFHLRHVRSWCRRRKVKKNFNGFNFLQSQLNEMMVPGKYPIRARLYLIFFIYSTGCLFIFLAPYIIVICVCVLIFFSIFDRYAIMRIFAVDNQFNFHLYQYLVRVYFTIMIPIYMYVYIMVFRERQVQFEYDDKTSRYFVVVEQDYLEIYGYCFGFGVWLTYIFFKQQISDFVVFKILGQKIPAKQNVVDKTYYQSYSKFFESFGIDALTKVLVSIFKSLEIKQANIATPKVMDNQVQD